MILNVKRVIFSVSSDRCFYDQSRLNMVISNSDVLQKRIDEYDSRFFSRGQTFQTFFFYNLVGIWYKSMHQFFVSHQFISLGGERRIE